MKNLQKLILALFAASTMMVATGCSQPAGDSNNTSTTGTVKITGKSNQ